MSKGILILGFGELFDAVALQFARGPVDRKLEKLALDADEATAPGENLLAAYSPEDWEVFAAVGQDGMNYVRLALFSHAKQRGFKFQSFIHPSAVVDPGAKIGQNCYIGEGAVVCPGARLDYNAFIGARSVVGFGVQVDASAWIGANCCLGAASRVGSHSIVDTGVMIGEGVQVGRQVVLQIPRSYDEDIPDKTYHHKLFHRPVRIYV